MRRWMHLKVLPPSGPEIFKHNRLEMTFGGHDRHDIFVVYVEVEFMGKTDSGRSIRKIPRVVSNLRYFHIMAKKRATFCSIEWA